MDYYCDKPTHNGYPHRDLGHACCVISFGEIIRLLRYGIPNSSAGIVYIAGIAGDHMKMEMENRLAGRGSEIEANVEAVGRTHPRSPSG